MANFAFSLKDLKRLPGYQAFSLLAFDSVPWTAVAKSLAASRVALVTTAGVVRKDDKPFNPRGDWTWRKIQADTQLDSQTKIVHDGYVHKDTDRDINCVLPLHRLRELAAAGFCQAAPLHVSVMGLTLNPKPFRDRASKEIAAALKEPGTDLVVLTPGCTVSHQAMGLIAREVEESGIPTVCVSLTREITDEIKIPRTAFLKFPLGHPFGHPGEVTEQTDILRAALGCFETIQQPGGVVDLPFEWTAEYLKKA